jgi:hypothetical protein
MEICTYDVKNLYTIFFNKCVLYEIQNFFLLKYWK